MIRSLFPILFIVIQFSCTPSLYRHQEHVFPKPVDTRDRPVETQIRKNYEFDGVAFDNKFLGARLNNVVPQEKNTFLLSILAENTPINPSPHYAFRISPTRSDTICIILDYQDDYRHRYWPKTSLDRENWIPLDSAYVTLLDSSKLCQFKIPIEAGKILYVASQEIIDSEDNYSWCADQSAKPGVDLQSIGSSRLDKDIWRIAAGKGKELVVILSRQHPPEISGYKAMQAFVEEILSESKLSRAFLANHRVLVYPMVNPDGVDEGHWRHNMGGIDLNRDWAVYNQQEIRSITSDIVKYAKENKCTVRVGIDFHSTWKDVYYTLSSDLKSDIHPFKDLWLEAIDERLADYAPLDSPDPLGAPISKTWFYKQFGAEGIVYEVGDNTDRDFIEEKAKVAAQEMMKLLTLQY